MLNGLKLPTTPFFQFLIALFDTSRNKKIDFAEFVAAVWAFGAPSRTQLIKMAFDMYDFGKLRRIMDVNGHFRGILWKRAVQRRLCVVQGAMNPIVVFAAVGRRNNTCYSRMHVFVYETSWAVLG